MSPRHDHVAEEGDFISTRVEGSNDDRRAPLPLLRFRLHIGSRHRLGVGKYRRGP